MTGLGGCVINEYDVTALGELCGELLLVAGALLFFQYADKGELVTVLNLPSEETEPPYFLS